MNYDGNSNYSSDPRQLVPLWEEMGASTGGLLGRFIGLNFLMGARFLSTVLNPFGYRENSSNQTNTGHNNYYLTIQTKKENEKNIKNIIANNHGAIH